MFASARIIDSEKAKVQFLHQILSNQPTLHTTKIPQEFHALQQSLSSKLTSSTIALFYSSFLRLHFVHLLACASFVRSLASGSFVCSQLALRSFVHHNTRLTFATGKLASYVDALWARHAFLPHERLQRELTSVHGGGPITGRLPFFGKRDFDPCFISRKLTTKRI